MSSRYPITLAFDLVKRLEETIVLLGRYLGGGGVHLLRSLGDLLARAV